MLDPLHAGKFPISMKFPEKAKTATVLPNLSNASLVPIGKLYNDNCDIKKNKKRLLLQNYNVVVTGGYRNSKDELYKILLPQHHLQDYKRHPLTKYAGLYLANTSSKKKKKKE